MTAVREFDEYAQIIADYALDAIGYVVLTKGVRGGSMNPRLFERLCDEIDDLFVFARPGSTPFDHEYTGAEFAAWDAEILTSADCRDESGASPKERVRNRLIGEVEALLLCRSQNLAMAA